MTDITIGTGKQILTRYRARELDMYLGAWGPDYPDPQTNRLALLGLFILILLVLIAVFAPWISRHDPFKQNLAFPGLVLALAFVAALGAGIENAVLAIALTAWPPYARIARGETLGIRRSDYICAVKLQGEGALRIITRHIWPLCIASVVVRITLDMAGIILTAAGLGFPGLGARPPSPEWGAMIAEGRRFMLDYWWVATIPVIAIFVASLAFNQVMICWP